MKLRYSLPIVFAFAFPNLVMPVQAQIVPGTGQQIVEVFDDFEDPNWSYTLNLPKSSANIDKVERHPSGFSNNRTFLESLYRGTPDFVRRVETPAGGIPGSTGALAMQTLNSGIPGQTSHTFQQDDLIANVQQRLGYMLPVSWTPSYTCRLYIPSFEKWERRHGSHFGFRADCLTTITKTTSMGRMFRNMGSTRKQEQYWPGFFVQLNLKQATGQKEDYAQIVIRGDELGHEVPGPKITQAGWWTLGMSFTSDGRVHYYVREGVGNLTAKDHVYSGLPYGYRCEQTSTYFFNIVNQDDGRSWSTRWIVDDPKVYVATGSYRPSATPQVVQNPAPAQAPAAIPAAPAAQPVPVAPAQVPMTAAVPAKTPAQPAAPAPAATEVANPAIPQLATKPSGLPAVPASPTVTPSSPIPAIPAAPSAVTPPAVVPSTPPEPVSPAPEVPVPAAEAPSVPSPVTEKAPETPVAPQVPAAPELPVPATPAVDVPATAPPATEPAAVIEEPESPPAPQP